jgi:hypothetical protein
MLTHLSCCLSKRKIVDGSCGFLVVIASLLWVIVKMAVSMVRGDLLCRNKTGDIGLVQVSKAW